MLDLANLLDHAYRELGIGVRELHAYLVVAVGLATPDDGPRRLERWFPHRNHDLDGAAPLEGRQCFKAQPPGADVLQPRLENPPEPTRFLWSAQIQPAPT